MAAVLVRLFAVTCVYLLTVLVIWLLSRIGPVGGELDGVIARGGVNIWFTAAGVVAAFVIIATLAFTAMRWM